MSQSHPHNRIVGLIPFLGHTWILRLYVSLKGYSSIFKSLLQMESNPFLEAPKGWRFLWFISVILVFLLLILSQVVEPTHLKKSVKLDHFFTDQKNMFKTTTYSQYVAVSWLALLSTTVLRATTFQLLWNWSRCCKAQNLPPRSGLGTSAKTRR